MPKLKRYKELHNEEDGKEVGKKRYFFCLSGAELDEGVGDKGKADTVSDGAGNGHCDEHDGNRDELRRIFEVDLF